MVDTPGRNNLLTKDCELTARSILADLTLLPNDDRADEALEGLEGVKGGLG
jgi:hypothetical protein